MRTFPRMVRTHWDPRAPKPGDQAADLALLDEQGRPAQLSRLLSGALVAIVFPPHPTGTALRLLLDYRDATLAFKRAGASVVGLSVGDPSSLSALRSERGIGFPLLCDPDGAQLAHWGVVGERGLEFALFVLDRHRVVKQRALGERVPPATLLTFLKRGGADSGHRPGGLRERLTARLRELREGISNRQRAYR